MLQVAEKDIRGKERNIKVMEDYIYMLEKCGVYDKDNKELVSLKKRIEKTKQK